MLCEAIAPVMPPHSVVVSPDAGRVQMATEYAQRLRKPLVLLHKRRESETETEVTHIVGDVRGQTCLIIDDMISTGGTIAESARALRASGANREVLVAATHGLLLDDALERLADDGVTHLFVTDSIQRHAERRIADALQVHVVSIAGAVAAAIRLQLVERDGARREESR
jgi:ribose-phosphate pyrophosphokinase